MAIFNFTVIWDWLTLWAKQELFVTIFKHCNNYFIKLNIYHKQCMLIKKPIILEKKHP